MDKSGKKAIADVHKTGTHVPEKDFSSSKKVAAAAGTGGTKKGSMTTAKSLPKPTATDTPVASEPKKWEGSSQDWSSDYNAAKRRGVSVADHNDSARDRLSDAAGEARMKSEQSEPNEYGPSTESTYVKGRGAFSNPPKTSHGFGHPSSARDGHLRNSGHGGAHRLGKK